MSEEEEKIESYGWIRLEPAENGFTLSYDCKKKNPMKKESTFECCTYSESKQEVFQASDSVSWDDALDQAAERLKELHRYNRRNSE